MVKRCIISIIACVFACSAAAVRKFDIPDYEYIQSIGKKQYDSMLHRFYAQDTTLSLTDIQTIYYGSAFYGYLGDGIEKDAFYAAKRRGIVALTSFLDSCLSVTPVDLQTLVWRFTAAEMAKDTVAMYKYSGMYNRLTHAIILSGNGFSDTTAVHVVSVADEYSLLTYVWHVTFEKQSLTFSLCDKMDCRTKNGTKKTIYFDVQLSCAIDHYKLSNDKEPFHFWYNANIKKQYPNKYPTDFQSH